MWYNVMVILSNLTLAVLTKYKECNNLHVIIVLQKKFTEFTEFLDRFKMEKLNDRRACTKYFLA